VLFFMGLLLLLTWGTVMMFLARWLCGSWLNHLSLYTFVWTASLGLYELHWIYYTPISPTAWLYIFLAWIEIYLGTALIKVCIGRPAKSQVPDDSSRLKRVIIVFSLAGLASCVVLARQIMRDIDPNLFVAVTVGAPQIYESGFEETGQFSGIPYLAFLPLAASALAGAYSARKGRIDWVSISPLMVATINGILSVSRWAILLSVVLFLFALYLTPKPKPVRLSMAQKGLLVLVAISGFAFVSLTRTDLSLSFTGQSTTLNRISEWVPVAPSVYFYLSVPPVGLSEYLRDPHGEANLPWGRYTFASIYRFLSKLGLATFVPFHQEFYAAPDPVNTCTYIREVHSDFGVPGIIIFPFVIGAAAGWFSFFRGSLIKVMALTHIYILILFSYTNLVMSAGQWFQSFVVSLIASVFLERISRPRSTAQAARVGGLSPKVV
jgi:oligosaccharide repeat unit polymerase